MSGIITPERLAAWRRQFEAGTSRTLAAGNALALMDALADADRSAKIAENRILSLEVEQNELRAALAKTRAQQADALDSLRQIGWEDRPISQSEDCWKWHVPCFALKIRRMLGDAP